MNEMGIGSRVVNYLVDTLIFFLISYGLYKWYSFYMMFYAYKFFTFYVFFWGTMFSYYFIFEGITGRTIGKFLTFTIVKTSAGKRPSFFQIFFRSLLRLTIIDPFFIPFLDRPLHDALSKTRVVQV